MHFLEVNRAALTVYGHTRQEFEKMTLPDLYDEPDAPSVWRRFGVDAAEEAGVEPVRHRRHDGSWIEVHTTWMPATHANGSAVLMLVSDAAAEPGVARDLRRRSKELQIVLEVSRRLTTELNARDLFDVVVCAITEYIPHAEGATLWELSEDCRHLVCRAAFGAVAEKLVGREIGLDALERSAPEMAEIIRRIVDTRESVLLPDAGSVARFQTTLAGPFSTLRSMLAVPLLFGGHSMGLLVVHNVSSDHAFDAFDVRLLESLGTYVAIGIRNARAYCEMRAMSRRLLQAQEAERRRIAQEMHDEIGGLLTSLQLSLSMNPAEREDARRELRDAELLVEELMTKVRRISLALRPSMLDDLGLVPTLQWYVERYRGYTGIRVTFQHDVAVGTRFESEVETAVFRIVQEALTNVARHAGVDEAQVLLFHKPGQSLEVHIIDRGRGFDLASVEGPRESMGLSGLRERAELLGGRADLETAPGAGTRITAYFPLDS